MRILEQFDFVEIIECNEIYVMYKVYNARYFLLKEFYNFRYFCIDLCMLQSFVNNYTAKVLNFFKCKNKFFILLEYYKKFEKHQIENFISKILYIGYSFECNNICYNNFTERKILMNNNDPVLYDFTLARFTTNNNNDIFMASELFDKVFDGGTNEIKILIYNMKILRKKFENALCLYKIIPERPLKFNFNESLTREINTLEIIEICVSNSLSTDVYITACKLRSLFRDKYNINYIIILSCVLNNEKFIKCDIDVNILFNMLIDSKCICFSKHII